MPSACALQRAQGRETGGRGTPSKLEASFACRIGQRLDAAVVEIAAAVEDHRLDSGLLRVLGQELADAGRLGGLRALGALQVQPAGGREGLALEVVDELRLDATVGAEHDQAGTLGGAEDLGAYAAVATIACVADGERAHARFPTFRRTYSPS